MSGCLGVFWVSERLCLSLCVCGNEKHYFGVQISVAFCSPAKSLTFSGHKIVGKTCYSPNIQATCTKEISHGEASAAPGWKAPAVELHLFEAVRLIKPRGVIRARRDRSKWVWPFVAGYLLLGWLERETKGKPHLFGLI